MDCAAGIDIRPGRVSASAGESVSVSVHLTNPGPAPALWRLRWVGVPDADVKGVRAVEVPPHREVVCTHRLRVPAGTIAGERELALEAVDGTGSRRMAHLVMVTPPASGLRVWAEPASPRGRLRARARVHVLQPHGPGCTVRLHVAQPAGRLRVALRSHTVRLEPAKPVTVRARVSARPRFGRDDLRSVVRVRAEGSGAPVTAMFTFSQRSIVPPLARRLTALVAIVSLWAAAVGGGLRLAQRLSASDGSGKGEAPPELLARTDEVPPEQR